MLAIPATNEQEFWVPTRYATDITKTSLPRNRHLVGFFMYGEADFSGTVYFKNAENNATIQSFIIEKNKNKTIYVGMKMDVIVSSINRHTRFYFSASGFTGDFIGVFA